MRAGGSTFLLRLTARPLFSYRKVFEVQVRIIIPMSGMRNGEPWPAKGEVLECGDDEGAALIYSKIAEPVTDDEAVTAPVDPVPTEVEPVPAEVNPATVENPEASSSQG